MHLKLYIYGYLNPVQSSRRLEREASRNLEVIWLLGRLAPDHKTIADFRKDNGRAIKKVCAQFVEVCRKMGLLAKASVVIDGSKFKAINNRDKNFAKAKVERRRTQLEQSVARYLAQLDTADRQERSETIELKKTRLREKLTKLKSEMAKLEAIEKQLLATPDQQISLTDPDSRSMATSGRGSGVVGYNVQTAVDTENHLIVAHEVSNVGSDRGQLTNMPKAAKQAIGTETLEAVADRGYFNDEEIKTCIDAGVTVKLPKPMTSSAKAEGRLARAALAKGRVTPELAGARAEQLASFMHFLDIPILLVIVSLGALRPSDWTQLVIGVVVAVAAASLLNYAVPRLYPWSGEDTRSPHPAGE